MKTFFARPTLTATIALLAVAAFVVLPFLIPLPDSTAAGLDIPAGKINNVPRSNANDLVPKILGAAYILAGTIAIISLIVAGISYITSEGDSAKTASARKAIIYSMVGLVFVGLAFIITGIIQNIANS